jgi:hypothetical protein
MTLWMVQFCVEIAIQQHSESLIRQNPSPTVWPHIVGYFSDFSPVAKTSKIAAGELVDKSGIAVRMFLEIRSSEGFQERRRFRGALFAYLSS